VGHGAVREEGQTGKSTSVVSGGLWVRRSKYLIKATCITGYSNTCAAYKSAKSASLRWLDVCGSLL